jgi:hypothetical protein
MIHGGSSMKRLATCHPDLQKLVLAAAEDFDLIVVCGHRGEQDQQAAYHNGTSKLVWPHSRHNSEPSEAVDLAPFPLDWKDLGRFHELGAHMEAVSSREGIPIIWGGRWTKFVDLPHFELPRMPVRDLSDAQTT